MSVRKKKLRTFQLCLISMCVSDLLFSLCLHPMSIATALGYDAKRIFNHSGCMFFGIMALFFGTYDMVAHSLIAVLRYMNLCRLSGESLSKRSLASLLVACVLYSMVWSIGPAFDFGRYETFEVGCTIAFSDQTLSGRIFVNCAFIFVFFLPLAVTVYSYIAIILEAGRQRKVLEKLGHVSSSGSNRLVVELKLVRLTSVIATAYVIAWFPYAIVCLYEAYGNPDLVPKIYRILSALFCKTAAATNPVIYLFMSKGFRREVAEMFSMLFKYKRRGAFTSFLYNSSQKSSSFRSPSEISLRSSWLSRVRSGSSRIRRKVHSNNSSTSETPHVTESHV
ncbi:opsin-5-like [Argiope bruennichi]|uniref:opsin-5-like n=1 Tax=Argiope bruennichi TaxID=94029 RepID=UPI002494A295|nr:opsin-5-like [Argiope bruennichi]